MDQGKLKKYAQAARRAFIAAVEQRAAHCGLTATAALPVQVQGSVALIDGRAFPTAVAGQRKKLEERIARQGFAQVMEAMAYTWFNRLVALRYMEIHGYLEHGYRVLSHPDEGQGTERLPEILDHAEHVELPGVSRERVIELKLAGDRDADLYRLILLGQCGALHDAMPFLFPFVGDETELLLPDHLLHSDSLVRTLVGQIPEGDWQDIEIVGWLYQYYISEKKDQVIGKVVKSEDIPAATQLFTPNWIVKYMVQNSLGAQWLATYPESGLRDQMEYYIEPAEQTEEVKAQLAAITPESLDPEALTLMDPACGSGHILVEAYDLFKAIYLERGYRPRDVAQLILEKNLYGLDIDTRAAQLAGFALMMKGRADDRRLFSRGVRLNVLAFVDSTELDAHGLAAGVELAEYGLTAGDLTALKQLFSHATTFGSLLQVPEGLAGKLAGMQALSDAGSMDLFVRGALGWLGRLVRLAKLLARRYDAVVANPPYMGSKGMNAPLKKFAKKVFPDTKSDLFAISTERFLKLTSSGGFIALMTPFTWMFLKSYKALRERIFDSNSLLSLIQPEYHALFDSAYVPVCTFVIKKLHISSYTAAFIRLEDFYGADIQPRKALEAINDPQCGWLYRTMPDKFKMIPGAPAAYWVSDAVRQSYASLPNLKSMASPKQGIKTGDNDRFLRFWQEVSFRKTCVPKNSLSESAKWFPCTKGGNYRKWYGNYEYVLNWEDDGREIRHFTDDAGRLRSRPQNTDSFFQVGITWSTISSSDVSMRAFPTGFTFESKGSVCFPHNPQHLEELHATLNSKVIAFLLKATSPTLDYSEGAVAALPIVRARGSASYLSTLMAQSQTDWDAYERSWDFQSLPLLTAADPASSLEASYTAWIASNRETIAEMQRLEEENNRLFIDAYGLQDELTPDVPLEQITLTVNPAYRYGAKLTEAERWTRFHQDTMKELISYAIGCMMGRYSLDAPGLIYAHSGNADFDPARYQTFPADEDGIVPITDTDWFDDDACNRLVAFIRTAWPAEHGHDNLADNLSFLASALAPKKGEQATDTIRRYLCKNFFKDHLRAYKKRPIYWLFSSGKQKAFECLVYLHRYHEGTLARMRTEYVIPLLGKLAGRIEQIEADRQAATATAHKRKLDKRKNQLAKQLDELRAFDDKLRHFADRRIALDLDDGVKVNYGHFGDLLAGVKNVTGKPPARYEAPS